MLFNNLIKITAFLLLLATLCSCQKDAEEFNFTKEYAGVDSELWTYFEKFETEAAQRGIIIDLAKEGITGSIEVINAGAVGICNHRPGTPNHVIVDSKFWNRASDLMKEMIIFHELGHCFLQRGHNDNQHRNGTCESIMRSGRGGCVDFYNSSNRATYLDELYETEF